MRSDISVVNHLSTQMILVYAEDGLSLRSRQIESKFCAQTSFADDVVDGGSVGVTGGCETLVGGVG